MTSPHPLVPSPLRVRARRRLGLAAAVAAMLVLAPAAWASATVEGLWRTAEGDGLVEIKPCGAKLCGYLVDHDRMRADPAARDVMNVHAEMRQRPMMMLPLLANFTGGPTDWRDGAIYNPENGRSYVGALKLLDGARLKVTGCLVRPLCGSQVWVRSK